LSISSQSGPYQFQVQHSRAVLFPDLVIQGHTSRDLKESIQEGKEINLVISYIQWRKTWGLYIFYIVPDLQIYV
jgi:hypothetical protein